MMNKTKSKHMKGSKEGFGVGGGDFFLKDKTQHAHFPGTPLDQATKQHFNNN